MHATYRSPLMKELRDQQVRFAPKLKKLEQIDRAESLLGELDPEKTYSYEYLCYRITDFRPELSRDQVMPGDVARHDVRLFVEDVSDAANIRAEDVHEPVHTVETLSKLFNVSTKTISRWRQEGLVSRRFVFGSGRKRVGFLQSSVDRFVARNRTRVRRGSNFSQLTKHEKEEIIERARRLARAGAGQSEVARRLAKHLNRSVETIRYTLKQFDREHPDLAIFPDMSGPLTDEMKRELYRRYRAGEAVQDLCIRYQRTRSGVYQAIHEMRARRVLDLPIDYIYNEDFDDSDAEFEIMCPAPDGQSPARKSRIPSGLPPYLAALYDVPLLTREQEHHLFRKFNYLKHRVSQLRSTLHAVHPDVALMDEIERYYGESNRIKNDIVQANLRLVVSIAKRHVNASEDFFSLVSDGNMSLIRAVERFDYSRGNKFSTYATWAIMRNFARTVPDEYRHRDRYRTSQEEMFDFQPDDRLGLYEQETAQRLRERQIEKILSRLDEREQRIIISRFGLDHTQEPMTLKEVGSQLGVTKERIRQIEARALNKMRLAAEEEKIELPE